MKTATNAIAITAIVPWSPVVLSSECRTEFVATDTQTAVSLR